MCFICVSGVQACALHITTQHTPHIAHTHITEYTQHTDNTQWTNTTPTKTHITEHTHTLINNTHNTTYTHNSTDTQTHITYTHTTHNEQTHTTDTHNTHKNTYCEPCHSPDIQKVFRRGEEPIFRPLLPSTVRCKSSYSRACTKGEGGLGVKQRKYNLLYLLASVPPISLDLQPWSTTSSWTVSGLPDSFANFQDSSIINFFWITPNYIFLIWVTIKPSNS